MTNTLPRRQAAAIPSDGLVSGSGLAASGLRQILTLTQSAYDSLPVKDAATLYLITGAPAVPVSTGPAKAATFTESFSTLDPARWTLSHGPASIVGGALDIAPVFDSTSAGYAAATSTASYDLTGSSVYAQLTQAPAGGDAMEAEFYIGNTVGVYNAGGSNALGFTYSGGTLCFRTWDDGSKTQLSTVTYDAATMQYWRLRHDGTTIYWETSGTASTWTSRANIAASSLSWTPNSHPVILRSGMWASQTSTADTRFGGVNTP